MESTREVFGQVVSNPGLRRVVVTYALFRVCEYGLWIAILVYAFDQGGATAAGIVSVALLVPAAVVAPLVASLADRRSPVVVLTGGYAVQGLGAAATAVAILAGVAPVFAYAGAVVVSCALTVTRPAQTALVPSLTKQPGELTGANVVLGWVDNLGILVAGLGTGLAITLGSVGYAFAAAAVFGAVSVLLLRPLRRLAFARRAVSRDSRAEGDGGVTRLRRARPARLLAVMLGAEYVVIGALDVLFVVMAVDLLHAGQAWAGYLNTAYGTGALLLGGVSALLVGRRLGPVIVVAALGLGVALAVSALGGLVVVVALIALVGGGRALFDVAVRVLLQRAVSVDLIARIFGLAEGLSMLGLAAGAAMASLLVSLGGVELAMVGVAAVLPLVVVARVNVLLRVDEHARVPVVEISLLRQLPLFRVLPGEALEGLAQSLQRVQFAQDAELMREGDEGDCYYAIADGSVEIRQDGRAIATLNRGDGLGEIALLRSVPRTATAVASTPVTVYRLDRTPFLNAVNGHASTRASAHRVASEVEARDATRGSPAPSDGEP